MGPFKRGCPHDSQVRDEREIYFSTAKASSKGELTALAVFHFIGYPLDMNKKTLILIFVSVFAGLSLGSVRQVEDPIRDTQTNPILYEQKKEEEKDGKKGPLMYSVKNNPRESFFIDPPFEKEKKTSSEDILGEEAPAASGAEGWWEEQPAASQAVSSDETVSASLPEAPLEAEKIQDHDAAEEPAAVPEAENAGSVNGDDAWW
jgi:hypothetical protein